MKGSRFRRRSLCQPVQATFTRLPANSWRASIPQLVRAVEGKTSTPGMDHAAGRPSAVTFRSRKNQDLRPRCQYRGARGLLVQKLPLRAKDIAPVQVGAT